MTANPHGVHPIPAHIALDHNSERLPHVPRVTQFYIATLPCGQDGEVLTPALQWGVGKLRLREAWYLRYGQRSPR